MNSWNDSGVTIKVVTILSSSLGFCCLLLCCGGYISSKKNNKKQNQIHFTNSRHSSESAAHIFMINVPDPRSMNTTVIDSSYLYLSENSPPTNEPIEGLLSVIYLVIFSLFC